MLSIYGQFQKKSNFLGFSNFQKIGVCLQNVFEVSNQMREKWEIFVEKLPTLKLYRLNF